MLPPEHCNLDASTRFFHDCVSMLAIVLGTAAAAIRLSETSFSSSEAGST
jgi:hypothetical protein